jgi:putative inorganic carbon (hco3(-)) transporter
LKNVHYPHFRLRAAPIPATLFAVTFWLTFLFMFLVYWRPQDWLIPQIYGWPILDVIVGASLVGLLIEIEQRRIRFPWTLPQPKLVIGVFLAYIFSNVAHTFMQQILDTWIEMFKMCFFTLLLIVVMDSPKKLRWVARLFVVMALLMTVHCLLQQSRGYGFAGARPIYMAANRLRPAFLRCYFFGIFEDPNDTGQFLACAIPFCFALFRRRNWWTTLLGMGMVYVLILGIMTTHSRGALVGLVAVGAMLVVLRLPQRWMSALLLIGLLGALPLCTIYGRGLDTSARERIIMWGFCNQYLAAHPLSLLFGLGGGMSYRIADMYSMRGLTMHNAFVFCYTEIGYFGFIFWFGLIIMGITGAWRVRVKLVEYKRDGGEEGYLWRMAGLAMVSMVGFCASGYFLSRAFIYPMFFLMAFLGVLPLIAQEQIGGWGRGSTETVLLVDGPRTVWPLCIIGAAVGMVYIWVSCIMLNIGA